MGVQILPVGHPEPSARHIVIGGILLKPEVAFDVLKGDIPARHSLHASLLGQLLHLGNRLASLLTLGSPSLKFCVPHDRGIGKHGGLLFIDALWRCHRPVNDLLEVLGVSQYLELSVHRQLYF